MKITIVGPAYPLRGGIAHHIYLLYRLLSGRNHSVQVISYSRLYPKFLFPGRSVLDPSSSKFEANALPIIDSLNPITWYRAFSKIRSFGPDLVLTQWWNPVTAPATGVLARLLKESNLNFAIECHNVFPHESTTLDLPLAAFAFGAVVSFIVHSEVDREVLLDQFPGKKVKVAPLPPPADILPAASSPRNGTRILFFGLVRRYKGLDVLLSALPKVLSEIDCKLKIAGEFYEDETRYRDLIDRLGISEAVEIDNRYIPNEEIPEIFAGADVLVLPYLSATQSSVANLAFQCGLPIIASRTGGLSETVTHGVNGLLVPPAEPAALADALIAYFKNRSGPIFSENLCKKKLNDETPALIEAIEGLACPRR